MIAPPQTAPLDKLNETFREKILRKCGESMEMKERFFSKYAEPLEAMSRSTRGALSSKGAGSSRWEMAGACATRCTSPSSSIIQSSRSAPRSR